MMSIALESDKKVGHQTKEGAMLLTQIQRWPHWEEIGKVALKEYGLTTTHYAEVLPEYQRFLTLIVLGTYPGLGMFSQRVDAVWHSHILSTHRYQDFCDCYYGGQIIHHLPCLEPKARGNCTVCNTCKGCNTKCKNCQSQPLLRVGDMKYTEAEGPGAPGSPEHFYQAYREVFQCEPPALWTLPLGEAEGFVQTRV